ncbi:condensin subunit ScpB [Arthrobacter crystallopoietes BAB-32]|uniref:Condensin subunit ScpB n=1 Tax=Arthrobacter crystallopoietes BAB-32 TaxID=1246476 RepID=N1UPQ2_9MICC|nr:SMC-Scp complex subunit ScpB [Arthrobacter crystallopoietes]EMY32371.1 condensin subunit ScpB [Arthrobacter crystallopoietes BAB-32]
MSDQAEAADGTANVDGLPGGARAALEAVLMVLDEPATDVELATALDLPVPRVGTLLRDLQQDYDGDGSPSGVRRGFELRNVAGGWRIFSRSDFADIVSAFVLEGQTARLTQAALETLAVIAYRQPVARSRVSAIRGVNVDSVVRTLVQRGLIEDSGADPETGAVLYRTTSYFLERLGIGSLSELPELAPHLPGLEHLADIDESSY